MTMYSANDLIFIAQPQMSNSIASSVTNDSPPAVTDEKHRKKRSGGGNKKGTSAERRATHNAVERARRESLNTRFLQLAANLPSTAGVRRPSKSLIVNKSIAFVTDALEREPMYRSKIDSLAVEAEILRREVNELRRQSGLEPRYHDPTVDLSLPRPMADDSFVKVHRECIAKLAAEGHDLNLNGEYDDDITSSSSNADLGPYQGNFGAAVATLSHTNSPSFGANVEQQQQPQQPMYFVPGTTAASFRRNSFVSSAYSQSNSSHGTPPDSTAFALPAAALSSQLLAHQPQPQQAVVPQDLLASHAAADFANCMTLNELLRCVDNYTPSDQDLLTWQQQQLLGQF